jgi:iron complex outermembrane receptor protein
LSTSLDLVFDGGNYYKSASSIDSAATALSGKGTSGSETPDDRRFLENLQGFLTLGDHKLVLGVENNQDNDRNYTLASSNWAEQDHYYETNINRNSNERISAVFAQDEWKVISPLTVYLGARFDNWDSSGGQAWNSSTKQLDDYGDKQASVFSPKVSVVYQLFKEGRLKASAGHSFDPPMPLQLYSWTAGTNSNGVASVTVGNPNLQPETDDAWEFGADFDFPTKTHVAATYFENYLHNLIYSGYEPGTNNTLSTYYNAGEAQDKGVEVEVKQQVLSNLDIFGNYTYAHNVFTENSSIPTSVGKFVPGVAEHTAHLGLDYSINKLTATLEANYSSKVYRQADNSDTVNGVQGSYDPFTVYNAKLSYRLLENGTIHVGVNNIFDNKYYAIYQQVGRYYEVGANLNLF